MMVRIKGLLQHLRTNTTISITALKPIVEDVVKYDIRDLKLESKVMDLKDITKAKHDNAENNLVDLRFINYISEEPDEHLLNARMTVLFMRGKRTYKLELFGSAYAKYKNELYVMKLQEYLYSYMTKSLEDDVEFMKFREIKFPDTLASLYRKTASWKSVELMDFTWVDRDETPTIAKITNGLLDHRSLYDLEEEEKDSGKNTIVNVNYDTPRMVSN